MCYIIALDLDGTLLSSENKITKYTKEIIQLLIKKNFYFVFASGRHYIDVMKIRDSLKIKTFMITSNGAKIYNLDNELIFSDNLEEDISSTLCRIEYADKEIITQIYQNDKWYINNNKIDNKFCPALSSLQYQYFYPDSLNFNNISKIFFTSKNFQKLYILERKITNLYSNKVHINFSVPGCLEIVSGNTSKGHGLKLISNLLGISLNNFIAFGDGMNDQDMLAIVGKAYIMKNADSRLKNALPHIEIIESNNNDGVARCLNKVFIKNNKNIL
ncbi:Cof-type HAD-IIB family hydrolase [Buchnera aphidicola (Acyrthosiphon lactucae)]|uniref:Cof-type HAD-IIB family hydrolase n=1 Tax=Buchnera aphidicola (Acyrthosiphon lactucae) TaxID=1241832 RepID=A0A4D6XLI8_9GAMM|nr:Cof-type HAD-IIB family hydrolase [Buchnera aphidicola]QCI17453.1 Cof-type HAD-IIB family hydrolase [Buchnera aphidicola (Acyrthosiphon lactucae)]